MPSSTQATTVLAHGGRIEGDLHLDHDAVIHGSVSGNVTSHSHLEVGPDAVIAGDVTAVSLTLAGQIGGRAVVVQTTQLLAGGQLQGPLETRHLTAAEGAAYEGQLRMSQSTDAATTQVDPTTTTNPPRRGQAQAAPQASTHTDNAAFTPIPGAVGSSGAVNAAIRPRRRVPRAS